MAANDDRAPNWTILDLETTGLRPDKGAIILEAALLVVCSTTLEVLYEGDWALHVPDLPSVFESTPPRVQEMHLENGLWEACQLAADTCTPEAVDRAMLLAITANGGQRGPLVNWNPAFDRSFLRAYCPQTDAALHYRMIDLEAFKLCGEAWGRDLPRLGTTAHRALDDAKAALEVCRQVRDTLYGGRAPAPVAVPCGAGTVAPAGIGWRS